MINREGTPPFSSTPSTTFGYSPTAGGATASAFDFTPGPGMELYTFTTGTPSGPEYNYSLESPDGQVRIFTPSGTTTSSGNYEIYTTPGVDDELWYVTSSSEWALYLPQSQMYYFFNPQGELVAEGDNNADTITYNWGSTCTPSAGQYSGKSLAELTSITDSQGRTITPSYNTTYCQVTGFTDSAGGSVSYAINSSDQLQDWVDPAGRETQYVENAAGDVTQITDPDGDVTSISYTSTGQVTQIDRDPNGLAQTWTFSYQAPGSQCTAPSVVPSASVDVLPAVSQTVVTDPNGASTTYCTDEEDRTVAQIDPSDDNIAYYYGYDTVNDVIGSTELSNTNQATPTVVQNTGASYTTANGLPSSDLTNSTTGGGSLTLNQGSATYGTGVYGAFEPATTTDTEGNTTSYAYNAQGDLTSLTDPLSAAGPYQNSSQDTLQFAYENTSSDANLLQSSTDADGNTTGYSYYPNGNLETITPPAPRQPESFTYDALSRVQTQTDGNGNVTTYTYNPDNQVTNTAYSDGTSVADTYDNDGNLVTETSPAGTESNTYNTLGELTQTVTPTFQTLTYTYDPDGNLKTFTDGAGTTTYAYNDLDQLTSMTEPNGNTTSFTYNALGQRTETTFPNGTVEAVTYNTAGQETEWAGTAVSGPDAGDGFDGESYNYTSANGTPTQLVQSMADESLAWTYTYDPLNRLVGAQVNSSGQPVDTWAYTYDGDGNRTGETINGTGYGWTYNGADELTSLNQTNTSNTATYGYDNDGNETADNGSPLTYNAADQTSSVGGNPLTFFGTGQSDQTAYGAMTLVDSQLGLSEITSSSGTSYIIRDSAGNPIGESTPTGEHYFFTDKNGSIADVTGSTGTYQRWNIYDPYGLLLAGITDGESNIPTDLGYNGAYNNGTNDLLHYGARLYDPSTGRWTQPDPDAQSLITDPTQEDAYAFAGDDPINNTDPTGTQGGDFGAIQSEVEACNVMRLANRHNPKNAYYFNQGVYDQCQALYRHWTMGGPSGEAGNFPTSLVACSGGAAFGMRFIDAEPESSIAGCLGGLGLSLIK